MRSELASLPLTPPSAPREGLSELVTTLVGSEILRIAGEVRELVSKGFPVLNLTVGDFSPKEFRIPEELEAALVRALSRGETNYPPSDGIPELRSAIQGFYRSELGLDYPLEGILVAGGARPVIFAAYQAILDPGDTVIYPIPSWNNNHYTHLSRCRGIAVETRPENGFLPTAEELLPYLSSAQLLALNSPLNPAGSSFTRYQLAEIAQAVLEENRRRGPHVKPLYVLYDQIYWLIAAEDTPHHTPVGLEPQLAPYTVFVDGISKAFAATGLRVGWAVGPPHLISRMRDFLGHVGAWAPRPEQVATAELFADPKHVLGLASRVRSGVEERLSLLDQGLSRLEQAHLPVRHLPPKGALYLSVQFDLIDRFGSNRAIRKFLLEKAGFAMVPFHAFGTRADNGWFRLSVGAVNPKEIAPAIERVYQALTR